MSYIYVVQMNIPAEHEAEFNRIYDTQHVPMLRQVPGVRNVTRYRLEKSNDPRMQKYLAIYEIELAGNCRQPGVEREGRVGRLGAQDPAAHHRAPPQLLQEDLTFGFSRRPPLARGDGRIMRRSIGRGRLWRRTLSAPAQRPFLDAVPG